MTITTILTLALLAPLAFGLLCAFCATRHASAIPTPTMTDRDFDRAFDAWAEYRASEEYFNLHCKKG